MWNLTSAPILDWAAIASDSTGQYLAAVANGGGIYSSSLLVGGCVHSPAI